MSIKNQTFKINQKWVSMTSSQLSYVDTISEYFTFNPLLNKLNWWQSVEKDMIIFVHDYMKCHII